MNTRDFSNGVLETKIKTGLCSDDLALDTHQVLHEVPVVAERAAPLSHSCAVGEW